MRSGGISAVDEYTKVIGRVDPDRSYFTPKRFCAGARLALDLKLQAARHALFIRGASKHIRFKTMAVQPLADSRHDF
jgi:hypothetical protein